MKNFFLLAAILSLSAAGAATPASVFYDNTLACQNQSSLVTCTLWLNSDGSYQVFFNRGAQKILPKSAAGPFQFEGREGTYTTKGDAGSLQVCLTPDTSTDFIYQTEKSGEVFAGSGCYEIPVLGIGTSKIVNEQNGQRYRLWMLAGR